MQFPTIPIAIDCIPAFRKRAEYTFRMLGLIAGFTPDFAPLAAARAIHYCYEKPDSCAGWLPASREAHAFLQVKNTFDPAQAVEVQQAGQSTLRLFPAGEEPTGDFIAATFFFLSLHEEWSAEARDAFGRFEARHSLLGKRAMLDRPVVAEYAALLVATIRAAGFALQSGSRYCENASAVCVTHDIDYITKATPGLMYREAVKYFLFNDIRQPFGARATRLGEYLRFCLSRGRDPYQRSLVRMKEEEEARGMHGTWFFKAGGRDKHDTGYAPSQPFVSGAIRDLQATGHEIGLHPSFQAHTDAKKFSDEREALMQYSGPLKACRQHYLRFVYPETWRLQNAQSMRVDSTLGFAEQEGFRNGTCHPFLPYDLERDEVIPIWEVPLVVMDGTLNAYRGLSPDESLARIHDLLAVMRQHNGAAALLFHNVTYDPHDFPGWDGVFERTLDAIASGDTLSTGMTETVRAWLEGSEYTL